MKRDEKNSKSGRYEAVVSDMDGVLLDSERYAFEILQSLRPELELAVGDAVFLSLVGRNERDCRAILEEHIRPEALLDTTLAIFRDRYSRAAEAGVVPYKPGADHFVASVIERGLSFAVATSTRTELARRKLSRIGSTIDVVIGGDVVVRGKPDPEIYLKAAAAVGVDPNRCLAIEDSEPGILAAHHAGMTVVWIPDLAPVTDAGIRLVTHRVDSLTEVLALL